MKNEQAEARGLPAWLDGGTVAIVGTVLTVGIGLGAMDIATRAHVDTRIDGLDRGLSARIDDVNTRIDRLDHRLTARIDGLSARIDGLERGLTAVQVGVAEIRGHLGLPSTVGRQGRKTGTGTPPDATPEPLP